MSDDLNERVAQLLDALEVEPDEIATCLGAVRAALTETQNERERIQALALDPGTSVVLAVKSRQTVSDLEFRASRLGVALDRLREKHQDALAREDARAQDAHRKEVMARRDELVARVKDDYPPPGECIDRPLEPNGRARRRVCAREDRDDRVPRPRLGGANERRWTGVPLDPRRAIACAEGR